MKHSVEKKVVKVNTIDLETIYPRRDLDQRRIFYLRFFIIYL